MKRKPKVQLEQHFALPTDPLSLAKLVFFQHLYEALCGPEIIVRAPVPSVNIILFDTATKRMVKTDYYKSLLLDEVRLCGLQSMLLTHMLSMTQPSEVCAGNVCRPALGCRAASASTRPCPHS